MKIFPSRDADRKSRHRVKWGPKKTMTDLNSEPSKTGSYFPETRISGSEWFVSPGFRMASAGSSGLSDVTNM